MLDPSLSPVSDTGSDDVLGMKLPSLPLVIRRRWIEVLEEDASCV